MKIRLVALGILFFLTWNQNIQAQQSCVEKNPKNLEEMCPIELKLATLVPAGSTFHKLLVEMKRKLALKTTVTVNGEKKEKITMKIFAAGSQGTEASYVLKMRGSNPQINMAAISTVGLRLIAPEALVLDLPNLVKNKEEREHMLKTLGPDLKKSLETKGYIVLAWSDVGFTYFFTNQPRATVEDLKKSTLFFWDEDDTNLNVWKAVGFQSLVKGEMTHIQDNIRTDTINTLIYTNSLASAVAFVPNEKIKYRINLPFSGFTGAVIIKKTIWDQISKDVQDDMIKICEEQAKIVSNQSAADEAKVLAAMKSKTPALIDVSFPAEEKRKWDQLTDKTYQLLKEVANSPNESVRSKAIPAAWIDRAVTIVKEYRKTHP